MRDLVIYYAMMGLSMLLPIEKTASGGAAPPLGSGTSFPGTLIGGV